MGAATAGPGRGHRQQGKRRSGEQLAGEIGTGAWNREARVWAFSGRDREEKKRGRHGHGGKELLRRHGHGPRRGRPKELPRAAKGKAGVRGQRPWSREMEVGQGKKGSRLGGKRVGRCMEGMAAPHPSKASNSRGAMGGEEPSSLLVAVRKKRQGRRKLCVRGKRRRESGGWKNLRGGSAKMPPLSRRGLLFIEGAIGLGFFHGPNGSGWNGLGPKSQIGSR
jgi:hypothetical protein